MKILSVLQNLMATMIYISKYQGGKGATPVLHSYSNLLHPYSTLLHSYSSGTPILLHSTLIVLRCAPKLFGVLE